MRKIPHTYNEFYGGSLKKVSDIFTKTSYKDTSRVYSNEDNEGTIIS